MADRATFSMQVPTELLERIDANALAVAGGNRTQYVLSWLPETYDPPRTNRESSSSKPIKGGR